MFSKKATKIDEIIILSSVKSTVNILSFFGGLLRKLKLYKKIWADFDSKYLQIPSLQAEKPR